MLSIHLLIKCLKGKENVVDDNPKWNSFGLKKSKWTIAIDYWLLLFVWTWFMLTRVWWLFLIIIIYLKWNETKSESLKGNRQFKLLQYKLNKNEDKMLYYLECTDAHLNYLFIIIEWIECYFSLSIHDFSICQKHFFRYNFPKCSLFFDLIIILFNVFDVR